GGPLRACGKRYATEEAARCSKRGLAEGAEVEACRYGCDGFHVTRASDRKAPASTGPDKLTRAAVYAREGGCCAACGTYLPDGAWRSVQHRVARGQGGGNET